MLYGPPMRAWLLGTLALVACDGVAVPTDGGPGDAGAADAAPDATIGPCLEFDGPIELGRLDDPSLDELSGMAASRRHPGLYYAHNDSGDGARIYVLDETAAVVGQIALRDAAHVDYEDIAVGPGPDGAPWVHVGDVGDNAARDGRGSPRDGVVVYRFPEPADPPRGALEVTAEALPLRYPDAPHDCESVALEADGALLMLTKEDRGPSILYRARGPFPATLEAIGSLELGGPGVPGSRNATAMDLSPGGALLVRSYNRVHLFPRADGEPWSDALARPPVGLPARAEPQGEAVAWSVDGRAYLTASEGAGAPLYRFDATAPDCAAP